MPAGMAATGFARRSPTSNRACGRRHDARLSWCDGRHRLLCNDDMGMRSKQWHRAIISYILLWRVTPSRSRYLGYAALTDGGDMAVALLRTAPCEAPPAARSGAPRAVARVARLAHPASQTHCYRAARLAT